MRRQSEFNAPASQQPDQRLHGHSRRTGLNTARSLTVQAVPCGNPGLASHLEALVTGRLLRRRLLYFAKGAPVCHSDIDVSKDANLPDLFLVRTKELISRAKNAIRCDEINRVNRRILASAISFG
jgi:hypothetical protein